MTIDNDYPNIINREIVVELQNISNLFELSEKNKLFVNRLIKNNAKNNDIYVERNIDKTLDNINKDINKTSFTGKELKKIITNHKFNQYNFALLELFKDIAEECYSIQSSKDDLRLIDSIDIFTLLYITNYLNEDNEKNLLPSSKNLFYEQNKYSSIFDDSEETISNPFLCFLDSIPDVEIRTESLIDRQSIDNLFYID